MIIEMEGFHVELLRKRIKNINLRINLDGEVKVSAPARVPIELIHRFLDEKKDWIRVRRLQLQSREMTRVPEYINGELHSFLGQPHQFFLHEYSNKRQVSIIDDCLHCYVMGNKDAEEIRRLLQDFYRKQLQALLPGLMTTWSAIMGVRVQSFGVKAMKTRWGSCNPQKGRIWINLHLIHQPIECIVYVVVHELVHLLEASHNARFYALMAQFLPDWAVYHKQLHRC